jgi:hypothetical protein
MNDVDLELLDQTITELRDDGRVSPAVSSLAQRVGDLSRGVVPKDQWHTLHQEVAAYGRQVEMAREKQSTSDTDRRVSALLFKSLNGDTHGMLQDLAMLLLQAYRDARKIA